MPDTNGMNAGGMAVHEPTRGRSKFTAHIRRLLIEGLVICIAALAPAVGYSWFESAGAPVVPIQMDVAEDTVWVDARPEAEFAQEHVPGAINLNEKNWDNALPRLFETWQPPRPIVVYCAAGCSSGEKVAGKLGDLGIDSVKVFEGGFEQWKRSRK